MQLHPAITAIPGMLAASGFLITAVPGQVAAAPQPLTTAQLQRFQELGSPVGQQTGRLRQEVQKTIDQGNRDQAATDEQIRAFLSQIGKDRLLVQNNTPAPVPGPPIAASPAPANNQGGAGKAGNGAPAGTTIKVKCDGGIYFDNDAGIFVYQKNVRLTESGGSFQLRCDDELKLLLAPALPDSKGEKDTGKKDKSFADLGALNQIIASGNVRISGKNEKGSPFLASGDIASYDASTGEMILSGGRPTLQQTANQYLQAQEPGAWIKIQMQDKRIKSIITSEGKWEMQTTTGKKSL